MRYNKEISPTMLRIGPVRFSYCNLFSPRVGEDGKPGKYGLCIIISKTNKKSIELINHAINATKEEGKTSKWNGKIPATLKTPLRDGDLERPDDPAFKNSYFMNCTSNNRPDVGIWEDNTVQEVEDREDIYSGCYGAVTIRFFPYKTAGNTGIGAGLNTLIKTEDGERLSGSGSVNSDFSDFGEDDDDELD